MRKPGIRTTLASRLRARRRQVRAWWCGVQADLEDWWERHVVGRRPQPGLVFGIPWERGRGPYYRDGRADIHVDVLADQARGQGFEADLVDVYLALLDRPAPKEVRTWD